MSGGDARRDAALRVRPAHSPPAQLDQANKAIKMKPSKEAIEARNKIRDAEIEVRKSEKWSLEKALVKAEEQLNEAKSFLRRYQTRYHGAEHAQKLWNEVDVF